MSLQVKTNADYESSSLALEVRALSKWYGHHQVLIDINLDVTKGQRIVICGPSGSGKSTFIRCLNGLEDHQKGEIRVDGIQLDDNSRSILQIRRNVGMVFQHFNLYPHLDVLSNCTLSLRTVLRQSRSEAEQTAMHFLEKVKLSEHARKLPNQLSGGQQQRVAIARALCMRPKMMLFDEPTSALDPELVREVLDTMTGLASEGMTMICVTHEMGFARRMADRIIFMDKGGIVQNTEPSEFFESSKNERVRSFLNQLSNDDETSRTIAH